MIRIFRAVIKRDQEDKDDPIFCNFMTKDVLDPLKTKFDLGRVKKFQINRDNYVALGLITDLNDINEDDLLIDVTYVNSVNRISFEEHQYFKENTEIHLLSETIHLNELAGNVGNLMFIAIETKRENVNCWDLFYTLKREYDSNKELINTILNSELYYGRKRKKFII